MEIRPLEIEGPHRLHTDHRKGPEASTELWLPLQRRLLCPCPPGRSGWVAPKVLEV